MFGGFAFCSVFRFVLGLLAHFNWLAAFKIRCVYVIMWKTFDLLWFWMHLFLCSCFPALRRENYKVIWFNLLKKRCTTHKAYSFSEIYMMVYGYGHATQSEVALQRIDTAEKKELTERAVRRSVRLQTRERLKKIIETNQPRMAAKLEDSNESSTDDEVEELLRKGLPEKKQGFKAANIRQVIDSKLKDFKTKAESTFLLKKDENEPKDEDPEAGTSSPKEETSFLARAKGIVQKVASPRIRRAAGPKTEEEIEVLDPAPVYILTPDYSNDFDIKDPKKRAKRERKDRRELRKRLREKLRRELEARAEDEKRRKIFTDAIDLLLQMLRMVTVFALVTWNVRKHNPLAAFKHLEIDFELAGEEEITSEDVRQKNFSTQWVVALSITVFLDVFMSMITFFITYYQQWQLLKRMGWWKSALWLTIFLTLTFLVMLIPASHVLEALDLSWCRVLPHSSVACYAPMQWVDFPLEDPRKACSIWQVIEGGGHRSPGNYSDFADHSYQGRRRFFLFF